MREKIFLTEKETINKDLAKVETNIATENTKKQYLVESKKEAKEKPFPNIFSAKAFNYKEEVIDEKNISSDKITSKTVDTKSSTIITPNFDFIETLSEEQHEQIFKKEETKDVEFEKKRKFNLKSLIFSLLFIIFGIWGIVNISTIDSLNTQIQSATETYNIHLAKYLENLANLDLTNKENMKNLFEVIPTDTLPPTMVGESSNWFDRFCNFLAGLFGG